jgi:serine/threonine protein phosphatase PrpC
VGGALLTSKSKLKALPKSKTVPYLDNNLLCTVVAASATGSQHIQHDEEGQDSFFVGSRLDGALIAVAADGAGSAQHGKEGSTLAVNALVSSIVEAVLPVSDDDWHNTMLTWLEDVRYALQARAKSQDYSLYDLSSTLLAVIVTLTHIVALQVGDGAIVIKENKNDFVFATHAFHGEYAGETIFITSDDYASSVSTAIITRQEKTDIAIMTDGLESVAIEQKANRVFAPFFTELFHFVRTSDTSTQQKCLQLTDFLSSERINQRTNDDKTLILVSLNILKDI